MPLKKEYLTAAELADWVGRSARTVRDWAARGLIPGAIRSGGDSRRGSWLFDAGLALAWTPPKPRGRRKNKEKTMKINLSYSRSTELVRPNHPGQFPRQMPSYLVVDWRARSLYVEHHDFHCEGWGESFVTNHRLAVPLPEDVDATQLAGWVEQHILPVVAPVAEAFRCDWVDGVSVPRFPVDIRELEERLAGIAASAPVFDGGGLEAVGEWYGQEADEAITGRESDADLAELAERWEAEAAAESVVLDGDLYFFLRGLRDERREVSDPR